MLDTAVFGLISSMQVFVLTFVSILRRYFNQLLTFLNQLLTFEQILPAQQAGSS